MRDLYGDQFDTEGAAGPAALIPQTLRRAIGVAVFIGLILAMGLWSYRLGTRDAGEVPIVRAMNGPTRIAPADPGGLQAPHQGLEVNTVLAERPAPVPELAAVSPEPEPLAAEDLAQGDLVEVEPVPAAARVADAAPLGENAAPVLPQSETDALVAGLERGNAEGTVGLSPFSLDPETPVEVAVLAPPPGPRPKGRPAGLRQTRSAAPPAPAEAPVRTAAAPAEAAAPGSGARLVQLGAFDSAVNAREAWDRLVGRHSDLLRSKSLYVERTTANARVFYRLRVAGFDDTEATRTMCQELRARGVDCIPVTLQ